MAIWDITQYTSYSGGPDAGRTTSHYIRAVDDTQKLTNADLLDLFGPGERNDVQITTPQDGVIEAKIQFTPVNRQGWMRDRDTPFDYIVLFRAVRRAG